MALSKRVMVVIKEHICENDLFKGKQDTFDSCGLLNTCFLATKQRDKACKINIPCILSIHCLGQGWSIVTYQN